VVGAALAIAFVSYTQEPPEERIARLNAEHPSLAGYLRDDDDWNYCLIGTANRLHATRDDFASRAGMVCQAANHLSQSAGAAERAGLVPSVTRPSLPLPCPPDPRPATERTSVLVDLAHRLDLVLRCCELGLSVGQLGGQVIEALKQLVGPAPLRFPPRFARSEWLTPEDAARFVAETARALPDASAPSSLTSH
jgi:hypothetical protein